RWWRQVMDRVVGDSGRFDIAALFRRRPRTRRRAEEPAQHFADDDHYDDRRYDQDGRDSAAFHQQDYAAGQSFEPEQSAWAASAREQLGSPREQLAYAQAAAAARHAVPTDQQGWDEPPREEAYDLDEVQAPVVVRRAPLRDDEGASQAVEDLEPVSEAEAQWDRHDAAQHYLAVHGVEKSFG